MSNNNRYQQFFIALRIWFIAVQLNTLLGTFFLSFSMSSGMMGYVIFYGTFYGVLVSLPALVLMFLLINRCVARKLKGITIFRIVLPAAAICAVIAWLLYMKFINEFDKENIYFLLIAIVSGVTAASTQYRSFLRLANYTEPFEETPL
ncbi:hypothetical protein D3H65_20530 [Paraflavitalea soli]|uniref:Uncharacterized protein n=1 Tax=Paraflavitalea soli TaxID=2315862 RepID=A0A3B7MT55_9BACT|nr:hypothetical protein [Paraflavitalea soli]AXY76230.1 hypothetical protein D3H65_20530 [Paraflavitalea soli]